MIRSLYRQILLLVSVVLALSVASYGWLASLRQTAILDRFTSGEAAIIARNMAELAAHHMVVGDYASLEHILLRTADHPEIRQLQVCEPDGRLLVNILRPDSLTPPAIRYGAPPLQTPQGADHEAHQVREDRLLTVWHPIEAGSLLGWLRIECSMDTTAALRTEAWKSAVLAAKVWISAGVLLLMAALRPSLKTIRKLANFARQLNSHKGEAISVRSGAEEVRELALALNLASSELKSSEEKIRSEREWLAVTLKSIGDGVIACDRDGHILFMNQTAEFLTGHASAAAEGSPLPAILRFEKHGEDEIARLLSHAVNETIPPVASEIRRKLRSSDNEERSVLVSVTPLKNSAGVVVGTVTVLRNVTETIRMEEERRKLEVQLRQAQKMQAIGTLAGGVAHDFNNILMAIAGYAELVQLDLSHGSKAWRNIKEVLAGCHRAKDLVQQILTFSRKGEQERMPIQMHLIVREVLNLLRSSIPANIEIQRNISSDCDAILANPTEMHQITMNLCVNAYHAMREKGGVLSVTLAPTSIETNEAERLGMDIQPGNYLRLQVSDTGHGMEQAVMERIFEPYFTTKKVGEGTGMGLAVVHGIVKRGGGHIRVNSEPGKGTSFEIYLPRFQTTSAALSMQPEDSEPIPGGVERLLFVDDDAIIVDLALDLLSGLGYQVEGLTDSQEALARFTRAPDGFDLVITDMNMPGMSGAELILAMQAVNPSIPIILCSGFSEDLNTEKAQLLGIKAYLPKPYPRRTLALTIRKVLDARQMEENK